MGATKLNQDEQALLDAFEAGEFASDLDNARRDHVTEAAEETSKKDRQINIRLALQRLRAVMPCRRKRE